MAEHIIPATQIATGDLIVGDASHDTGTIRHQVHRVKRIGPSVYVYCTDGSAHRYRDEQVVVEYPVLNVMSLELE